MNDVTKSLIKIYSLKKLKYDFMGYTFNNSKELSFHHLIIPKNMCKMCGIGKGYLFRNGVILTRSTAHDYLHLVESIDPDRFFCITSELLDENLKGFIDINNLIYINDILCSFEKEYCGLTDKNNKLLIKEKYTKRIIK